MELVTLSRDYLSNISVCLQPCILIPICLTVPHLYSQQPKKLEPRMFLPLHQPHMSRPPPQVFPESSTISSELFIPALSLLNGPWAHGPERALTTDCENTSMLLSPMFHNYDITLKTSCQHRHLIETGITPGYSWLLVTLSVKIEYHVNKNNYQGLEMPTLSIKQYLLSIKSSAMA